MYLKMIIIRFDSSTLTKNKIKKQKKIIIRFRILTLLALSTFYPSIKSFDLWGQRSRGCNW